VTILWYVGAFVLAIGVLVTVHEFGHFIVARLCGVKVLRFSLGFGRVLLRHQKRVGDTEWVLCAVPLGGYVRMLDEREAPVPDAELSLAFNRKSVWRRLAIVVAGPVANLLLAVLIYWVGFMHGVTELRPVVAQPTAESPAALAGVRSGDEVLEVGTRPTRSWTDVRWALLRHLVDDHSVALRLRSGGGERVVTLATSGLGEDLERTDPLKELGLSPFRPEMPPVIGSISEGGPAAKAGLRAGDRIEKIGGRVLRDWEDLVREVSASPGRALLFEVRRRAIVETVSVVPDAHDEHGKSIGRIGVAVQADGAWRERLLVELRYNPFDAFGRAVRQTWEMAGFSLKMLGRMVTGHVSLKNISGPVTIADYAGQSARIGADAYVRFLALISISIAVLNLLPIPLLDGGHIMYYLAEILMRRPVSQKVMEIGQQIGFTLLASLMAFAFFNDITRLLS